MSREILIQELAKQTLNKWSDNNEDFNSINPFCRNCLINCSKCLMPKIICNAEGSEGLCGHIKKYFMRNQTEDQYNHSTHRIKYIPELEKSLMIHALRSLSNSGCIDNKVENAIEYLCNQFIGNEKDKDFRSEHVIGEILEVYGIQKDNEIFRAVLP